MLPLQNSIEVDLVVIDVDIVIVGEIVPISRKDDFGLTYELEVTEARSAPAAAISVNVSSLVEG